MDLARNQKTYCLPTELCSVSTSAAFFKAQWQSRGAGFGGAIVSGRIGPPVLR
jgi:hypothetical protein